MSYLLDTNIVSEWVRPRPEPKVVNWLADIDEDRVFLSVVTLAELRHGVERLPASRRRTRLDEWLRHDLPARFEGRVLPIDETIAAAWGAIVARREAKGRPIGVMDAWIAATAETHELTLVTRNAADFRDAVSAVLDPWASP
ncbi:MAG: type II toxin-antitoxin system VapC family toxin [Acidobacteriota bacterium]|nr:type II toxin-antitoxin system VapC family toxin [Acidobacteriota bacterium]